MIDLVYFQEDDTGAKPFVEWHSRLRDTVAKMQIAKRLSYVQLGNFADCSPVGEGVIELRVHVGAGYRVYCARHGQTVVLLLCGGDKRSQSQDIKLAQRYWAKWKEGR